MYGSPQVSGRVLSGFPVPISKMAKTRSVVELAREEEKKMTGIPRGVHRVASCQLCIRICLRIHLRAIASSQRQGVWPTIRDASRTTPWPEKKRFWFDGAEEPDPGDHGCLMTLIRVGGRWKKHMIDPLSLYLEAHPTENWRVSVPTKNRPRTVHFVCYFWNG